jgi:hypothetical protein
MELPEMSLRDAPTLRDETAALDEDAVFDIANLTEAQTGVRGVITITTEVGRYGPKVRYATQLRPRGPGLAVSIGPDPRVLFGDMEEADRASIANEVIRWVALNRQALIRFWEDGAYWMMDEVETFVAALRKV